MKQLKILFYSVALTLTMMSCQGGDNSADIIIDDTNRPTTIKIDNLTIKSYQITQANPAFQGSSSYLIGIFAPPSGATKYTVRYFDTQPASLGYTISWSPGESVPDKGAMNPSVPGYELGYIGGNYHIKGVANGCQSSVASGVCALGGANTLANEQGLLVIGGKMEVTIEY